MRRNSTLRRKTPILLIDSPLHRMWEYTLLLIGSFIIALSFNLFLNPNEIASGGVSGLSTIVERKFAIEPAITQWVINIPLFITGILLLGGKFGLKTAVGSFTLPLFVLMTQQLQPLTNNILLASIYGGIGIGVGLGIVFRGRGSTGGLDLTAQIMHKYTGMSLGLAVAVLDGLVILTAGVVFSPEKALYAFIGLFVTSKTIDMVQGGFAYSKVAFIISTHSEAVRKAVLYELDRGMTKLEGSGGYTGQQKDIWMVVVGQTEVMKLKTLVKSVDAGAFIIVCSAAEVLGEGFKV